MNHIDFTVEGVPEPGWLAQAQSFCEKILKELSLDNCELSIVFCNNEFIRELNHRFRGKNEPTDVLSFSQNEGERIAETLEGFVPAGDIVISLEMLEETKTEFKVDPEEELKRLLIHGILHLAGYDHSDNSPEQSMLVLQENIVEKCSEEKIF